MGLFTGEDAQLHGFLPNLPLPIALPLSILATLEAENESTKAKGENLKRYYEALGNLAGVYNRTVPQMYDVANRSTDAWFKFADEGQFYNPNRSSAQMYRYALPSAPGPYQHGGGVPFATFNPSDEDVKALQRIGVSASNSRGGEGSSASSPQSLGQQWGEAIRQRLFGG